MSFNFVEKVMTIGGPGNEVPTLQFYKKGFSLSGNGTTPSWQDIILSGNTALTLVNAKEDGLNYLKLFGATEQRNLPSGYQQLDYLQGDGTAYIETDVIPTNNTGMKIVFEYATSGSGATSGVFDGASPRQDTFFISTNSGSIDNSTVFAAHRGTSLSTSATYTETPVQGKTYTININYKNSGTMGIEGFTQTNVGTNDVLSNKVILFARLNYNYNNITASSNKIKYVEFTEGTEVIRKYYPASYNNELGLYDTVTNTFLTNKNSTGDFTAGADVTPTPDNPMDIVSNNGVVKLSPNLFDVSTVTLGHYYNDSGEWTINKSTYTSAPIYIGAGATVTFSRSSYAATTYLRIQAFNSNNEWIGLVAKSETTTSLSTTGTTPANTAYIRVCGGKSSSTDMLDDNIQVERGSTATQYRPYGQIYTDGTQETVTVPGNLFDKTTVASGYRLTNVLNKKYGTIGSTGDFVSASDCFVSALIPVEVGKTYIKNSPDEDAYHRYRTYDVNQTSIRMGNDNSITIESGEAYISFCGYLTELDSTALYDSSNIQTATAEMLLAVGSYQDIQEVLAGDVTRNIGIKVLDGTEDWVASSISNVRYTLIDGMKNFGANSDLITCSHYVATDATTLTMANGTIKIAYIAQSADYGAIFIKDTNIADLTSWTNYLKDQYNAGHPVIIVYPLATPTEETVTAQPLSIQAGTNIITAEGSIDNLELEVSYKATA